MAVGRPGAELDLSDELGADIAHLTRLFSSEFFGEGTFGDALPVQPLEQIGGDSGGKAGANAAHIVGPALIGDAQDQGADGLSGG